MRPHPALLALSLAACSAPEQPEMASSPPLPPADTALSIASYNVFYGGAGDPDTLHRAATLDSDILALQETNDAWEAALRPALAKNLGHCRFHPPVKYLPGGLGVCSRFPILEDELVSSPVGWFPAQRVVVDAPAGPIEIFNVHLKPAVAGEREWWAVHRATRPDRRTEIDALAARFTPTATLVVGDFNEVLEGDAFAALERAGLDNAFKIAPSTSTSWKWAGAEPPLEALLDHVAYDRASFELVSADVVAGGRSDHDAVVVRLRRMAGR